MNVKAELRFFRPEYQDTLYWNDASLPPGAIDFGFWRGGSSEPDAGSDVRIAMTKKNSGFHEG